MLVGNLLDALSLLPGVQENGAVRTAALAPSYVVLGILGAVLPSPSGAVFYEVQTQGATKRYFAHVEGQDFVKQRDELKAQFEQKA